MITLITGLPGHAKTLYALELLRTEYKDREYVFVHGIDDFDYDEFGAADFDPLNWQQLPDGALIVIDEVHKVWPKRNGAQRPPAHIEDLAEHRHRGFDFLVITQAAWDMDSFARGRVDRHLHVKRNFGQDFTNVREFQGFEKDPGDKRATSRAVGIKRWIFKKDLYKLYKSSTKHTVKKRYPVKLVGSIAVLFICCALLVNLGMYVLSFFGDDPPLANASVEDDSSGFSVFEPVKKREDAPAPAIGSEAWNVQVEQMRSEYFLRRAEAVDGLPWTAELYQEIQEPVSYPKPRCILAAQAERCVCHSQQGTRLALDFESCSYFARNGYFDPTLPDQEPGFNRAEPTPRAYNPAEVETAETLSDQLTERKPLHTNWNRGTRFGSAAR